MASSSSPIVRTAATGILQSSLSPKYLHTNSTSHTWPFSAIAELIDNAYDPDVKASQLWIDKIPIYGKLCLTFTDNGNGMQPDKLHKMLSFGFCEKVADGTHMPVGHYGNGFKSGSMRLGKDALVLTKQENVRSIGYLSQTYLATIKAETVVVPLATWDKENDRYILRPSGVEALSDIFKYSLIRSESELNSEFDGIESEHGTRIIISNIRKTTDNKPEFDFETDEYDIRIPDDTSSEGEKYRKTKRQNHVPECDYSLRAYCAILYLKPKMQIFIRGKKVKTLVVEKSLFKTEVDQYKPKHAITAPVKVVFGFNGRNKNHYGIMMYHRNRLIKPYERVGYQLRANNLGVGVVGVVQCDFLQPTHNKQDFDYTKAYRACLYSLGVKLNEYWNEKKGFVKSSTNSVADQVQADLEPQEVQALPDQTWVQCDDRTCLKWRKLPDGIDPDSLPEKWYCFMNPDPNFKSCDVPEEKEEEKTSITPYQKTQKRRLVKEMEEKQKREKAAKLALIQEQEDKKKELEKREELLKKKEELLNSKLQTVQHENYNKTKIKVEGGSLPTAQVAPRPTTKPLNAVTPNAKPSPRQIGSQLAARLNQSATRTPQTNQSGRSPVKAKLSPALARSNQSAPSSTQVSQSTPKSSLNSSQLASRIAQTNQSTSSISTASQSASETPTKRLLVRKANQATKSPNRQNVTILETKTESGQSVKIIAQPQKLGTTGITFKMVKAPNGTTYLVQEKNSQGTKTTTGTKPTATVVKASGPALAAISASVGSPATGQTKSPSISVKPTVAAAANTTVDVKPRLNVLPKPQISTAQTALVRQQNGTSTQNTTRAVNKTPANVDVKPSLSLAASAYSEITGNTTTTPQDVRNILASGIKREAAENVVSPIPAKVQRTKPDAAVIVIDPLPTQQEKSSESDAQKRIKELENRVKTLDNELSEVKTEGKNRLNELVEELQEKSRMLIRRNKEFEEKKDELQSKQNELREKTRELKVLRGNVCKLLQVLVPEIDVESEGDGDTVDDLLRQVLEANK